MKKDSPPESKIGLLEHEAVVPGNPTDKYGSRNPLVKLTVTNFIRTVGSFVRRRPRHVVLDVGSGNGELLRILRPYLGDARVTSLDLSPAIVREGAALYPELSFVVGSGEKLPFRDGCCDLVLGCEYLEHVEDPARALEEMVRVAREELILSVPVEPLWRILNVLRCKNLPSLGNSPGHVNHWSGGGFLRFLSRRCRVSDYKVTLPWIIAVCGT